MNRWTDLDVRHMRRAIRLSMGGYPAPNPHVGCVIAQGQEIVGEGYHSYAGGPHAEAVALQQAGAKAAGATAYVTLEPCNHHGRTPPCSEALLAAKIKRVVIACLDPNPRAQGGMSRLEEHGVEVISGCLESQAAEKNEQFLTAMRLKRCFVTLKAAISLDGRIALPNGESQWITAPDARKQAHRLRALCGAVLVGRNTVEKDNPALTARIPGVVNQPMRVVLDPQGKLTSDRQVFDAAAPTLHLIEGKLGLKAGGQGFDPKDLCAMLFKAGIMGVLIEGGAVTHSRFLQADLVDRIELFVAPKVLGSGVTWIELPEFLRVDEAPSFQVASIKKLKVDVQISLRPERGNF